MQISIWRLPATCDERQVRALVKEAFLELCGPIDGQFCRVLFHRDKPLPRVKGRGLYVEFDPQPVLRLELNCVYFIDEICIELLRRAGVLYQYEGFTIEHLCKTKS